VYPQQRSKRDDGGKILTLSLDTLGKADVASLIVQIMLRYSVFTPVVSFDPG